MSPDAGGGATSLMLTRITLCVTLFATLGAAQDVRFRDEVFSEVVVTDDVAYGGAVNRWTGLSETLLLDVYEPLGDTAADPERQVREHARLDIARQRDRLPPLRQLHRLDLHQPGRLLGDVRLAVAARQQQPCRGTTSHDHKARA